MNLATKPTPILETPAAAQSEPVVELQGLEVKLGKRPILQGLNAKLTGRCIGLLGPNGAGKTTLLHTLLGFYPISGGSARVFGHDVRSETREIRSLMGYMPENDAFIPGMTAVRFVRLMAELSGLPKAQAIERAHEVLFYVGLGEARYRPVARQRMLRLIKDITEAGDVRVILSSHLLRDVEECCDEVIVLKAGKVAVTCNLEEERRANRNFLELELRTADGGNADPGFVQALEALGAEIAPGLRQRLKLVLPEGVQVRDLYRLAAERKIQLRRLDYKRDSLEDIFLKAMEV